MSKIYEALKSAQKERSTGQRGPLGLASGNGAIRRSEPFVPQPSEGPPVGAQPRSSATQAAPVPKALPEASARGSFMNGHPAPGSSQPVQGEIAPGEPPSLSSELLRHRQSGQPQARRSDVHPEKPAAVEAETPERGNSDAGALAEGRGELREELPRSLPTENDSAPESPAANAAAPQGESAAGEERSDAPVPSAAEARRRLASAPSDQAAEAAEPLERPRGRRPGGLRRPLGGPLGAPSAPHAVPPARARLEEPGPQEARRSALAPALPEQPQVQERDTPKRWRRRIAKEVASLYRPIRDHLPEGGGLVAFVGVDGKTGTSLVAREFAQFLASDAGHGTLLLDGDAKRREQFSEFRTVCRADLSDVIYDGLPLQDAVHSLGNTGLSLAALSGRGGERTLVVGSPRTQGVMTDLRKRFEYVIVDCPLAEDDPQALNLCGEADLTIMVLSGGKTEAGRAARLKAQIEAMGGRPFGVVLNTRGFNLPRILRGLG